MHQPVARPKSPKWRGTNLARCPCEFGGRLNRYAVTGTDIVQQEIAVGMERSGSESSRNGERAPIDGRARGRRDNGRNVTNRAAYVVKLAFTEEHIRRDRPARCRLCRSHKVDESLNICAIVFRFWQRVIDSAKSDELALRRIFIRKERTGDAHFIEIGITRKRQQTAVLAFPSKPANAGGAIAFKDSNLGSRALLIGRLCVSNGSDRAV